MRSNIARDFLKRIDKHFPKANQPLHRQHFKSQHRQSQHSCLENVKITTNEDNKTKEYIGMTANKFKVRYKNHNWHKSFNDPRYDNEAFKICVEIEECWEEIRHQIVSFEASSIIFGRWKTLQFI